MTTMVSGRVAGKRAIVTGAGSGIGWATAERFAREGAWVALLDIDLEAAEGVAVRLREVSMPARFAPTSHRSHRSK